MAHEEWEAVEQDGRAVLAEGGDCGAVSGETWQLWAERFINATNLRKYNMPSPYQYQNWQDWAFQMMLSVNHG